MKTLSFISYMLTCLFLLTFAISCEKDSILSTYKGSIEFAFAKSDEFLKSGAVDTSKVMASYLLLSIKDESGNAIFTKRKIELYNFNGSYISEPVALTTGNYLLTEFYVLDENNQVIYASPVNGSELAHCVTNPLPLNFTISKDHVTKLIPEVISACEHLPIDFGYLETSFEIINTFSFKISVFIFNNTTQQLELTSATLSISDSNTTNYSLALDAITNLVTVNSGLSVYNLEVTKPGYVSYNISYIKDSLNTKLNTPIIIVLTKDKELILQPNSVMGKDSYISTYVPDENYGDRELLQAYCWTFGGEKVVLRFLIEFDLSDIPPTSQIYTATLSLYESHEKSVSEGHYHLSGSNECFVRRITSSWDENTVIWNNQPNTTEINQVILPQDTVSTQNYTDIDVTSLIQDIIDNRPASYGLIIGPVDESPYRSMLFASSDHQDASKHPKLVVKFK